MSLTVSMLVAYSFISNVLGKVFRYTDDWMSSIIEYFSGITNEWYFLDTGLVPAVPAPVYRKSNMSQISWVYNMSFNVLAAPHSTESSVRLPFLSASLISNNRVYPMDDFLEDFRVIHNSENGKVLTPREIVLCWEIYNRTWLDSATLTVIDRDGNDYTVDGFGRGSQEWLDMLYVMEDEEDTEEEEGEEEEEEGEEADDEASTQEQGGEQEQEQEQEQETPATEEQVLPVLEQEAPLIASITLHNPEIVPEELVVNA